MVIGRRLLMTLIALITLHLGLNAEITLTEIYNRDYELINRTVILISGKPDYKITQNTENREIKIEIASAIKLPTIPTNRFLIGPVLEAVNTTESEDGGLTITIKTRRSYYLESFYMNSQGHRVVLDIYPNKTAQTLEEKKSFINFYTSVGYHRRALPLIQQVIDTAPDYTGINYYWGIILLNRRQTNQAIEKFKSVDSEQQEYLPSQMELLKLGAINFEFDELFTEYLSFLLKADTQSQRKLMLALLNSLFGDAFATRDLLQNVDFQEKETAKMLENLQNVYFRLDRAETKNFSSLFQEIVVPQKDEGKFSVWLIIIIVAYLISIFVIIKLILMLKKVSAEEPEPMTHEIPEEVIETTTEPEHPDEEQAQEAKPISFIEKEQSPVLNSELRRDIALKLHREGWSYEAIADELKVKRADVEKIVSSEQSIKGKDE